MPEKLIVSPDRSLVLIVEVKNLFIIVLDRAPSEGDCNPLRGSLYPGSLTTNGEGKD